MKPCIYLAFVICVLFTTASAEAANKPGRPNIVVLLSDDCGYNEFSLHGSKIPTPRIDSIAANGVKCTNGYVSGSVCSPTRAGLLTGRYQQCFGHEYNIPPVYSESNGLPLTETLLPAVLKDGGYRTIALGKWHLGYAPKFHPMERGFTDFHGFLQGQRSYFPLEKPTRLNQLLHDRKPVSPEPPGYMTDLLADEAVSYIADSKDKPFFIYLAFNATHGPMHATEDDLARAGGKKIPAMTMALDRAVGKVLDALKKHDLTENTLVFFLNDNGGATGHDNSPLRGHKGSCWEGGMRVPFVVQWPAKLPKGVVYEKPVIALDIFPTAMVAAGITKSPGNPLHGVDLVPYFTNETTDRPHPTLYWKNGSSWAVRDGDLKLVVAETGKGGPPALYDLAADPSETKDLSSARPDDVRRIQSRYDDWKATHKPTPWGPGAKK